MKKYLLMAAAVLMGAAMFTSCEEDEEGYYRKLDFEDDSWKAYVDKPQFMGNLLYGDGSYSWEDSRTKVTSKLTNAYGDGKFWGGGIAISNYVDKDIKKHAAPEYQLSVPKSNGSNYFAIVYCDASLTFSDDRARKVKSIDVSPTTYQLGVTTYGDDYAASLAHGGELTLVIKGIGATGGVPSVTVDLAKNGELLTTWTKVDLTPLGKVKGLSFSMTGSDVSEFGGVKQPQYAAIDNFVVEHIRSL